MNLYVLKILVHTTTTTKENHYIITQQKIFSLFAVEYNKHFIPFSK